MEVNIDEAQEISNSENGHTNEFKVDLDLKPTEEVLVLDIDEDNGLQVPLNKNINYKNWHTDYPIRVKRHPTNGRYLISTGDLENNTVLLKDLPYTWAVDHCAFNFVCQQCFLEVPLDSQVAQPDGTPGAEFIVCEHCERVGYCSEKCRDIDSAQHNLECAIIERLDTQEYSSSLLSEIKLLVRTLSRKWLEQQLNEYATNTTAHYQKYKSETAQIPQDNGLRYDDYIELVSNVESFQESLKESLTYWICNYIVKLAREECQREEDGQDLLAILLRNRCNAFYIQGRPKEGGNGESRGCGVYVRNSFFNHSCNPNVNYWVVNNSLEVECSLVREVKKGDELTISYIDTTGTLEERREKLKDGYLFECQCTKCRYEEEYFNTHGTYPPPPPSSDENENQNIETQPQENITEMETNPTAEIKQKSQKKKKKQKLNGNHNITTVDNITNNDADSSI